MTIPNHPTLKASTLRTICTHAGVPRDAFLRAYRQARGLVALRSPPK